MAINRKSMAIGHPDMELHHLSSQVSALLERCPHLPADAETATASRNSWCFCWAKQLRCNTFWPLKVIARDDAIWMCLKMEYSSNSMAVVHRKKKKHPEIFGLFRCPRLVDLYRDSEGWKHGIDYPTYPEHHNLPVKTRYVWNIYFLPFLPTVRCFLQIP